MRRRAFLAALAAGPAAASDALETVQELHRDQLAGLGDWSERPGLGVAWRPSDVPPGWRPFSVGRWIWTIEGGWYWQGDLLFSRIAEHRGRWRRLEGAWWWLPGSRFEPAPVAWGQAEEERIAWAPLPTGGRSVEGWSVLPVAALADPAPPIRPAPADLSISRTAPPDPRWVEAASGRPVVSASLADLADPADVRAWFATDTRSLRGIADPAPLLSGPAPAMPSTSGPVGADDAAEAFARQHRQDLRQSERLRERDRQRERDLVR
ncbi:DUF6600 domain-containing protein [Geminicoccus roseus]|uniref:DUF6600 domain-containing protein n=1 Tax=Geminicoccus roseus TaxID=404900 RepID=UPI00041D4C69|nr:DUF6600 domain-containing protein [Geminicoccus roseus]